MFHWVAEEFEELEASPYGKSTDVAWLRFRLATIGQ
jgi:hypothetical protein